MSALGRQARNYNHLDESKLKLRGHIVSAAVFLTEGAFDGTVFETP
jgi:hypothetical protein